MRSFDLVLFDLDGLLVDTERLHWQAYRQMCQEYGYVMDWDYPLYLQVAGGSAEGIRDRLQREHPGLFDGRTWAELYEVKRQKLFALLASSQISLMQGVEEVVSMFAREKIPMWVVTHSPKAFVDLVQKAHPIFLQFRGWVYREMYGAPKPAPDGYRIACQNAGVAPDRAIGFEDTVRGIDALVAAHIRPVLVNMADSSARTYCNERGIESYCSFDEVVIHL